MSVLEELQSSVQRVSETAGGSVVGLGRFGSGTVIAPGLVLTNAHVLRGLERTVVLPDGSRERAQVVAADPDWDLAVLRIEGVDTPVLAFADAVPGLGAPVFALARPGGRSLRVTLGLVASAERSFRGPRGRRVASAVEHTAPLPRGSSGAPLVDAEGRLVGRNTLRLEGGLIVALAADAALRERVDALVRGEAPARPTLGVALAPPHVARRLRRAVGLPERPGLLVREVADESPAARAGIERGDLIVAAGGTPVESLDELLATLDAATGPLELGLVRGSDERTVQVEVAS
jgi:serine protease Do